LEKISRKIDRGGMEFQKTGNINTDRLWTDQTMKRFATLNLFIQLVRNNIEVI